MADFNVQENPYTILGLEKGHESTDAEIKKAFRKLALTKHPDKQPNNPNAAAEFGAIQRAYEVLLDAAAKEAWDNLARARAVRVEKRAGDSAKRRKMSEDLERRERAFRAERSEEQSARARLQAELERLKRQHAQREAQAHAERVAAATQAAYSGRSVADAPAAAASRQPPVHPAGGEEGPPLMTEQLLRSLKVSWDAGDGGYTSEQLREVFSAHGPVADVVIRAPKQKQAGGPSRTSSKGSAFVEMATLEGAAAAARAANGLPDRPLLVVPFSKVASVEEGMATTPPQLPGHSAPRQALDASRPSTGARVPPTFPLFPGGARTASQAAQGKPAFASFSSSFPAAAPQPTGPGRGGGVANGAAAFGSFGASSFPGAPAPSGTGVFGSGNRDFESLTLMKMRQKAERERLIAEMAAKDPDD